MEGFRDHGYGLIDRRASTTELMGRGGSNPSAGPFRRVPIMGSHLEVNGREAQHSEDRSLEPLRGEVAGLMSPGGGAYWKEDSMSNSAVMIVMASVAFALCLSGQVVHAGGITDPESRKCWHDESIKLIPFEDVPSVVDELLTKHPKVYVCAYL